MRKSAYRAGIVALVAAFTFNAIASDSVVQPRAVPSLEGRVIPKDAVLAGGGNATPGETRIRVSGPSGCELNYTAYGCPGYKEPPMVNPSPTPTIQCHCNSMVYSANAYWQTWGRYFNRADCDAEKAKRGNKVDGRFTCVPDHDPVQNKSTGCYHLMPIAWIEFEQPYSQCIGG